MTLGCLTVGLALAVVASFTLADGSATPGLGLIASGAGWVLVADEIVCVIAVELGSLTGSRGITLTALIGWELGLAPNCSMPPTWALPARRCSTARWCESSHTPSPNGTPHLSMSIGPVVGVMILWPLAIAALGAWRTATRDA